jgi:hypothetical protein
MGRRKPNRARDYFHWPPRSSVLLCRARRGVRRVANAKRGGLGCASAPLGAEKLNQRPSEWGSAWLEPPALVRHAGLRASSAIAQQVLGRSRAAPASTCGRRLRRTAEYRGIALIRAVLGGEARRGLEKRERVSPPTRLRRAVTPRHPAEMVQSCIIFEWPLVLPATTRHQLSRSRLGVRGLERTGALEGKSWRCRFPVKWAAAGAAA